MPFTFFSSIVRYVSSCGLEILPIHHHSSNNNNISSTTTLQPQQQLCPSDLRITWSILQSVVAFILWLSCAIIGVRSSTGVNFIFPSTLALFFTVALITHAIAASHPDTWGTTVSGNFYVEIYMWAGAFVIALVLFWYRLIRVPLTMFTVLSCVGGVCQMIELGKPGTMSGVGVAGLCALSGSAIVLGAVGGGFLDQQNQSRRVGIVAGSLGQAFVVTPLVFAASHFDGCHVLWRLRECSDDSQMSALAVTVSTFIGSCVVGLIVQCCWAYRDQREEQAQMSSVSLHYHIADLSAHDLVGEDLASRRTLQGQSVPHLDDRWSRMGSPRG